MKTNREIQTEADLLMVRGREFWVEQQQANARGLPAPSSRALLALPDSHVTVLHGDDSAWRSAIKHRYQRHVEAAIERDAILYRLVEKELELTASGDVFRETLPWIVVVSPFAVDPLRTGYELVETERMAELLEPYAERSNDPFCVEPSDARSVAEVEAILESRLLPYSERLRTKAEIVDFLEGRLEPSAFIAHAVERQISRESVREVLAERHEMRLTIGEP